jgi:hypothetical protein
VLLPRIKDISKDLASPPSSVSSPVYFNSLVEQLKTNPSKDCPPGNDPSKLEHTYDGMLLSLLQMVGSKAKDAVKDAGVGEAEKEERLAKELGKEMEFHVNNLAETIEKDTKELEKEEAEQKKHITMDDLHDGFSSKVRDHTPQPSRYFILMFSSYTVCTADTRTNPRPPYQTGEERERKSDDDRSLEPQSLGAVNKWRSYIQTSRRGRRGRRGLTGADSIAGGIFQNPSGRLPEVL